MSKFGLQNVEHLHAAGISGIIHHGNDDHSNTTVALAGVLLHVKSWYRFQGHPDKYTWHAGDILQVDFGATANSKARTNCLLCFAVLYQRKKHQQRTREYLGSNKGHMLHPHAWSSL